MTITYSDGRSVEAVLLSRTENSMRLAVQGAEDVMEFSKIRGVWVSEECEPVSIQFAWQRNEGAPDISEEDFCCSHELAARLIHALFTGEEEAAAESNARHQQDSLIVASAC